MLLKIAQRIRRHKRIRARVSGSLTKPRLCVFRSGNHIYAQLIDDAKSKTLVSASSLKMKGQKNKTEEAKEVGRTIAKFALEKKIANVVFDRGGYQYHGRVKALAEGAREAGLKF
jgi:large subunit ribosomal protein L18